MIRAVCEALHPPIPSLLFPGSRSRRHHLCFFRFNGVVELGRGVFGFRYALRPRSPLWGLISGYGDTYSCLC